MSPRILTPYRAYFFEFSRTYPWKTHRKSPSSHQSRLFARYRALSHKALVRTQRFQKFKSSKLRATYRWDCGAHQAPRPARLHYL